MKTACCLGAGGFIGSHMVKRLKSEGYWVRGVDLKYPEFSASQADEFEIADLREFREVQRHLVINYQQPFVKAKYFDEVYQFACEMGGAGYVFTGDNDSEIMRSTLIDLNVCEVLKGAKSKVFYSSSACMYPDYLQKAQYEDERNSALKESHAYPASPDSEYGWQKLYSERLYLAYARNHGLDIRIARFHNIYGPEGTYDGGREKFPAAVCRKVIQAIGIVYTTMPPSYGWWPIEIWGDGLQTRSFLYIDDCIDAVRLLMESDFKEPINIGSEEMVSINELAEMVITGSGKEISIKHIEGPQGVRGRNSDNTLARKVLNGWEPKVSLKDGMTKLYGWISEQYRNK